MERKILGLKVPAPTRIIPCRIQIGQSDHGTDPIWIWGNTGQSVVNVETAWSWGNPCGFDWNTFFQWWRDAVNTSLPNPTVLPHEGGGVSGLGGTPKPGYTPYTYPHPLRSSPPAATQRATPSSVQDHSKKKKEQNTRKKKRKRVKQNSVNEMTRPPGRYHVVATAPCVVPNAPHRSAAVAFMG